MSAEAKVIESMFFIQDKYTRVKTAFALNKAQRFFDNEDNPYDKTRIIVAKARQKGFSSVILAKLAVRCLGKEGTYAACVSHEAGATQRLLDKADYYIRTMRGPKPVFGRKSRTEMYFSKMESSLYIGTAGAKAFGRGDTITDLHCSEYAWWEDPLKHSTGLFQAVPSNGRIYIESTGNGRNNDFYTIWDHADRMGYTRMFYPWYADEEYSLELPLTVSSWKPDTPRHNPYLLDIKKKYNLNDKQMWWYETKLRELREDITLMQQEYPSEPDECFQATGGSVFSNIQLSILKQWQQLTFSGLYIFKHIDHPIKDFHYVIGADPSGGTGNDDAAVIVFCCETFEQVFELYNNRTNPFSFAQILCEVAKEYNDAYITCEANNHGAAVIPYLKTNYKHDKIYKRKYGTKTTPPQYGWNNSDLTKHAMIGMMQEMLDQITLYGIQTVKELKGFEENKEGKLEGKSDNLVIATGLGMMGLKRFEYLRKEYLKPIVQEQKEKPNYMTYSLDEILKNINTRKIPNTQVGAGYPSYY